MLMSANTFRDEFGASFGIPTVRPRAGESFDVNNDLFLCADGRTVIHRDGHVTMGGPVDALLAYNKRHMAPAAFSAHYGEDETVEEEFGLLHGV